MELGQRRRGDHRAGQAVRAIAAGLSRQSIPDLIDPGDITAVALFLASDDAKRITKQCLSVNGELL